MARKVNYPVRAAFARFAPIYSHLNNMGDYLYQAGLKDHYLEVECLKKVIGLLERDIKPLQEKI